MSYCCHKCFIDSYLVARIKLDGKVVKCSLCSERRKCLDIESLQGIFLPVISLYANAEEFQPIEMLKDLAGEHPSLAERLASDWNIFDDEDQAARFLGLCQDNCNYKDDTRDMFDPMRSAYIEDFFYFGEYQKSSYLKDKWSELRRELQESNRFFAGRKVASNIEEALKTDVIKMTLNNEVLYRVRATTMDVPYAKTEMGAPPAELSTAGRANPAGIPYLYLASDQDTAICEVRPHANERLSVGSFRLIKPVTCIDLRSPDFGSPFQHGDKLHDVLSVIDFLGHLGNELSVPIGNHRREHEYLPTQYLCEMIKNLDYDGVVYNSGLDKGYNIALFSPSAASCFEVKLVQVKSVKIVTNDFVP
jgi:hypothetical protein